MPTADTVESHKCLAKLTAQSDRAHVTAVSRNLCLLLDQMMILQSSDLKKT